MKLSGVSIFWEHAKKLWLKSPTLVALILKCKGLKFLNTKKREIKFKRVFNPTNSLFDRNVTIMWHFSIAYVHVIDEKRAGE